MAATLVAALLAASPATAQEADGDDRIGWLEIGLAGVTADMEDGKELGQDCRWYGSGSNADARGCWISLATLERAGVPVVDGNAIDLADGIFGRERYRLAGRITNLEFRTIRGPTGSVGRQPRSFGGMAPGNVAQRIREPIVDYDGNVVGYTNPPSNDIWRGVRSISVKRTQVGVRVDWVLYDSETSTIVAGEEEGARADGYADAVYGSMERFLHGIVEEE